MSPTFKLIVPLVTVGSVIVMAATDDKYNAAVHNVFLMIMMPMDVLFRCKIPIIYTRLNYNLLAILLWLTSFARFAFTSAQKQRSQSHPKIKIAKVRMDAKNFFFGK